MCIDPHADKYFEISPYAYSANNPIIYIDPTGEDYAIYFTETKDKDGNITRTATITATYYVKSGDKDAKESANEATGYWNNKNGQYTYTVGKGDEAMTYNVNFDLKVVEVDDPVGQANYDKSSLQIDGKTKMVTDGSSNAYEIVPDDYTSKHGESGNGYIGVEESDKSGMTGTHEVGHSIGLAHSSSGLMFEGINGGGPPTVNNWNIKDIFKNPSGSSARQYLYGNVPRNYKKGKVKNVN
jgi:hypothetical protein